MSEIDKARERLRLKREALAKAEDVWLRRMAVELEDLRRDVEFSEADVERLERCHERRKAIGSGQP